jgi:hypothetical protein
VKQLARGAPEYAQRMQHGRKESHGLRRHN